VRTFGFDPSGSFTQFAGMPVDQVRAMRAIAGLIGVDMPPA
jgi:hypothetical protein